jgi:hypothetical protein
MFKNAKAFDPVTPNTNGGYAQYAAGHLEGWNTASVTDMSSMFEGATEFNDAYLTQEEFVTTNVTTMAKMFKNSGFIFAIRPVTSDNWNTSNVTDMTEMFYGSQFGGPMMCDVHHVTSYTNMFKDSRFITSSQGFTRWNEMKNAIPSLGWENLDQTTLGLPSDW